MNVRKVTVAAPLLVISGIAAQQVFDSKVSGNMVSADWVGGTVGYAQVMPVGTADSSAYAVNWRGCAPSGICTFAGGLLARSAIKAEGDKLAVALDIASLSVIYYVGSEDCNFQPCKPMAPPNSVPLDGTFTVYRGIGSSVEQSNGSTQRDAIFAAYPNGTLATSQAFSGKRVRYTASFAGVVGGAVIPGPTGPNATLTIMNGQQTYRSVYVTNP